MSDQEQFLQLIYHGQEERNLEYKQSVTWNDDDVKAKIAKSIIAMSNLADGGDIIIGVEKDGTVSGMNETDFNSFDQDSVKSHVNRHAVPYADFSFRKVIEKEKNFIVFQVAGFSLIPIICARGWRNELNKGVIYIRSKRMPESTAIGDEGDLRELMDLAVDKWNRYKLMRQKRAGIFQVPKKSPEMIKKEFNDEAGDFA